MRAHRAFTLIELIVALAVIALLAGLLLSALPAARQAAHGVQCQSRLRQLGLAVQMYWSENQGRLFPYLLDRREGGRTYWFGWLGGGSEGRRRFQPGLGPLWPYLEGRGVELCPSFSYRHPLYKPKAAGASWGYGYNLHLSPSGRREPRPEDPALRVSDLGRSSDLLLLADAAQINDFQSPASSDSPMLEEFYYVDHGGASYANGHFRHRRQGNAVFLDGHAEPLPPEEGTRDLRLPQFFVARYPEERLVP